MSPQVNLQSSSNNETYQERLARLEGDKESLVLQVRYFTKASKAFQHNSHNVNTMRRQLANMLVKPHRVKPGDCGVSVNEQTCDTAALQPRVTQLPV